MYPRMLTAGADASSAWACIALRMHAHAQYNYVRTYARALAGAFVRALLPLTLRQSTNPRTIGSFR
jgi:hypothetical protein